MLKKISIEQAKRELLKYQTQVDKNQKIKNQSQFDIQCQLIMNNITMYNELIQNYEDGNKKNVFLLYQLNGQLQKQLTELKKQNNSKGQDNEPDKLTELINNLNAKKYEKR